MSVAEGWKSWEGRVVDGKFPLRQWLGGSEHGGVFLTHYAGHEPPIAAIKLVTDDGIDAERQLSLWRKTAKLSHPNLIRLFEAGRSRTDGNDLLYVVTECAEEDLSQILPQRPLTPTEVGDMLPPLLDALSYLHRRGLVHGRIKPSNVLAVGDQLKLSADHVAPASDGNPRRQDVYDAPETAAGIVSLESDIWSVGVTLLTALTQSPTFAKDSRGDPSIPAAVPEPYRGIVRECMHLDPKRRCSIPDIIARLQPSARSVPAQPEPAPVPKQSISRGAIGLAVLVVAVLAGLTALFSRGKHESPPVPAPVQHAAEQSVPTPAPAAAPKPVPSAHEARGEVVHQVLPEVSPAARHTIEVSIKINVRVDVDPSGKVTAAKIVGREKSKYFAREALQAAERWEFSPPESAGQPKASAWMLRFKFGRTQTQVTPDRLRR